MAELKYAKNIITDAVPNRPELGDMRTRLIHVGDDVIPGSFHVDCVWYWRSSDKALVDTHTHEFDEVLGFLGSNTEDPHDLGGEIEIWLDDEKHIITKSCMIFIPKGLKHCPYFFRRVDRPILHLLIVPMGTYHR